MPLSPSRVSAGDRVASMEIETISRARIAVPFGAKCTHLQFRRFAGCPVCTLHLRSFVRLRDELGAGGVQEVIFFHASREALLKYHDELPFPVVADPNRRFYRQFGVVRTGRAVLHPKAWVAMLRGAFATRRFVLPEHGPTAFGLPADFLIDPAGRVLASKYGRHADDQWSVEEVIALAASAASSATEFTKSI